jgi:hypothetical protein
MSTMFAHRTDWETRLARVFRLQLPRPQRAIQIILLSAFCMVMALSARPAGMPKVKNEVSPALALQLDASCSPFGTLMLCVDTPPA